MEEREFIVYLEVDVSVRLKYGNIKDAEKIAKEMITIESVSPLVIVDDTRIITSEEYKKKPGSRLFRPSSKTPNL